MLGQIIAVILCLFTGVDFPVNQVADYPMYCVQEYDMEYDHNLYLMAHLINGEAGSDWCSDEMMYYVGSVVLNRVDSEYFPDTIEEVIYAPKQYACTWDGNFDKEPCERAWRIAEDLLLNGSVLPANVVFQAQFIQGDGIYCKEQNMYFCYIEME